ncbi:MAG: iron-containing alcohol dehydrogenase family protein [Halothece sp.]
MKQQTQVSTSSIITLQVSPAQVMRGKGAVSQAGANIAQFGKRPLIIGGDNTLTLIQPHLEPILEAHELSATTASYLPDSCDQSHKYLQNVVADHKADFIIGVGGGKALDMAKLVASQSNLPIVTIPTSAATCAAWTALSNIYSEQGAFQYDVPLPYAPNLLILDYDLIASAPKRTLIAGIGDALAKWYEASVSSGDSTASLTIAAVQQARVLRDILLQKSATALENPGGEVWQEIVDAAVLLPGVIGGLGGANCRTVAAHAIHNGLTHLRETHDILHGEKVAYGILVQLRLEEMVQDNQLAASARQQLLEFYAEIGLPKSLEDLGLENVTLVQLRQVAEIACAPHSDIHRLPFTVQPMELVAAMVSTTVAETHKTVAVSQES